MGWFGTYKAVFLKLDNQSQHLCLEKIIPWLKEMFGAAAYARSDVPIIGVSIGSAFAQVEVNPWGEDDATVTTRAYVVSGARMDPDLLMFLLRENNTMRFGGFGLDENDDIFFEHTIVGSSCDAEELKSSVLAVVMAADLYDEIITARWGGVRALDQKR